MLEGLGPVVYRHYERLGCMAPLRVAPVNSCVHERTGPSRFSCCPWRRRRRTSRAGPTRIRRAQAGHAQPAAPRDDLGGQRLGWATCGHVRGPLEQALQGSGGLRALTGTSRLPTMDYVAENVCRLKRHGCIRGIHASRVVSENSSVPDLTTP